jgi:hypothetical protein
MTRAALKMVADDGTLPLGRLTTCDAILEFVLAGNAYLTLRSKKTGTRYTYRVSTPKGKDAPHFVSVLYGADNVEDYVFIGTIFDKKEFRPGRRSAIQETDPRVRAWRWMWSRVRVDALAFEDIEVWHEGRCGRCGRMLTVPESIARGIGPECASKTGGP